MAAIGRVFALLSAGCAGIAGGMWIERLSSKKDNTQSSDISSLPYAPPQSKVAEAHLSQVLRKGLPSEERVRCFDGYVASLNYERRVPNWVMEHFPYGGGKASARDEAAHAQEGEKPTSREGKRFFADSSVPESFRVHPEDYSSASRHPEARGLSRGHLAAAQFHKSGADEMAQTFNMNANIVPQDMTMNAVDWLRLENLTRQACRWYPGGVWVASGPAFLPRDFYGSPRMAPTAPLIPAVDKSTSSSSSSLIASLMSVSSSTSASSGVRRVVCYELVGKHHVAVPTHLFKVILGEKADGTHEIAGFLMPNGPIAEERPITEYQVPVATIERATGLQFFPHAVAAATAAKNGIRWSIDRMPSMCARHSCEVRTMPLFQGLRGVARLRAAQSVSDLESTYRGLVGENGGEKSGKVDAAVIKEYTERMRELMEESVREID